MPYRAICDVLYEMRACHKTRNYGYLKGLIEEVQTMANRMESALEELKWDEDALKARLKKVKKRRKDGISSVFS